MKIKSFIVISAMQMLCFSLSSCNNDEVTADEIINDVVFAESANSSPEFADGTGENPRYVGNKTITDANGVEITRDSKGGIRWISFLQSSDTAPSSSAALFSQYMKLDPEKDFRLYRRETNTWMENPVTLECYQQQYKGVVLYQGGYSVRFQNGKVTDCNGVYVKIDNLDVEPSFDVQKAKDIYAKYLKVSVDEIGTGGMMPWFDDALMIEELPVSKGSLQWAPRLVYGLSCQGNSDEGFCFIDAHSGRILQTWPNYKE